MFRFSIELLVAIGLVGLGCVAFGLWAYLNKRRSCRSWALPAALFGIVVLAVALPGMSKEAVVVSPIEVIHKAGLWWDMREKGFRYDQVTRVVRTGTDAGGEVWFLHRTVGQPERLDIGDLWARNADEIARITAEHGVLYEHANREVASDIAHPVFILFRKALQGDRTSIAIIGGGLVLIVALMFLLGARLVWRGKKLARELGDCEIVTSPDGQLGKRVFTITGHKKGLAYTIESARVAKKEYRTRFSIFVPSGIGWADVEPWLLESREGFENAWLSNAEGRIDSEFEGVGWKAAFVETALSEVAQAVSELTSDRG